MFDNYHLSHVNMPAVLVANGLGTCLMLAILLSRHRRIRSSSLDGKIFYGMCLSCLFLCAIETAGFMVDGRQFSGARQISILCSVVTLCLAVLLSVLWCCYVDYRLFQDRTRIAKIYPFVAIPAVLVCLAAVCNLFFGVFFWATDDNVYYRTQLFFIPCAVMYGYITYGAVLSYCCRKRVDEYLFMPVMSFLIPVYVGSAIQLLSYGIALTWVSVALGLTLLYINLQSEDIFLDPLTNLYNRNYLVHYMDRIPRQVRAGMHFTGILLDVNNFKLINDTYGHVKGDGVLRAVGQILLRATSGSHAVVVRYGGDEFMILLPSLQPGEIQCIKDRIGRELDQYNISGKTPIPVSLSAGISELRESDLFRFFQDMDRAMYRDKKSFYLNTSEEVSSGGTQ